MKGWMASIAVVTLLGSSAAAAGSTDCPAALDFHQRPLMGDKKEIDDVEPFAEHV